MPVARQPAPTTRALRTCIARYRTRAATEPLDVVWKQFRSSKTCGQLWFAALLDAYGHRCLYCDHAQARTIDHCKAKTTRVDHAFAWRNFRPACSDCNHQKGTRTIVDPVSEDPCEFLAYDVSTGKPATIPTLTGARQTKSDHTRPLLDNQTLNEARRAKRHKVLDVLARFNAGERGYDAARVRAELAATEPHRAIVRELVLGAEINLHQWSPLVRQAMRRIPTLKTWALAPIP
jgi:5-methylcytosine-specific restriction endonuclease McrA